MISSLPPLSLSSPTIITMWQVAVAAAVAGSGLIAKHLFSPNADSTTLNPINIKQIEQEEEERGPQVLDNLTNSPKTLPADDNEDHQKDGIFRFSSSGSDNRSGSRSNSKKSRNLGKNFGGFKKKVGRFDNESVDQTKSSGKRVSVCLKRRKTSRNSTGKRDSSCSKDCSSFGWGLGLGIIYMMSAGKAEISKLSCTMDETAKLVHELKAELNKPNSSHCPHLLENSGDTAKTKINRQSLITEQADIESCTLNKHSTEMKVISHLADSEYASSVLTEEQQPEFAEMDQMEAEFESELEKLPWCTFETSENKGNITTATQIERRESENQSSTAYQSDGVCPAELKTKLSHLLIKQQESHILELESELNLAHSKLQDKEAELRAVKDCVRRLTEFSLSSVSEACREQEESVELDNDKNMGPCIAVVGSKRTMDFHKV